MTSPRPHLSSPEKRLRRDRTGRPDTHAAEPADEEHPLTRAALRRQRAVSVPSVSEQPPLQSEEARTRTSLDRETGPETPLAPSVCPSTPVRSPQLTMSTPAGNRARRVGRKLFAIGVLAVAGSFAVGMTIPATVAGGPALDTASRYRTPVETTKVSDDQLRAFVTPGEIRTEQLDRQGAFSVASVADLAAVAGIRYFTGAILADPSAAVQWPFPVGVPTSSNYGPRGGRQHEGADFAPGEGAEIQTIADGVVPIATEQGGAFGVTVYIEHVVDGRTVFSRYAHMQYGSLMVSEGQQVSAGQKVGLVGNTGRSFGAHLHLEITAENEKVDPVAWLQEKTGR